MVAVQHTVGCIDRPSIASQLNFEQMLLTVGKMPLQRVDTKRKHFLLSPPVTFRKLTKKRMLKKILKDIYVFIY